jgi:2-dehydro-3-deoxyphosphogluconate aldolase/(4S)-4-hydroxy-2-oxoglutarate aldolase
MDSLNQNIEAIEQQGFLPLYYHADASLCIQMAETLYACGVRVIEFTNRGEHALKNFEAMLAERDKAMPGLRLAVGTIRTAEQARRFIDAGADMLISPVFDADVADMAYLHKILWIPGCMTPTEIHVAENAGCGLVKLFPGNVLGPDFVSGIRELFPGLRMMPTGGVELEEKNLAAWFRAGVCAVGLGSRLISKDLMANRDLDLLKARTLEAIRLVNETRANRK